MKLISTVLLNIFLVGLLGCTPMFYHSPEAGRFDEAKNAVVRMSYDSGSCTAFHVGEQKFLIADHCLHPKNPLADIILIDQNDQNHEALILARFPEIDSAVLKAETFKGPSLQLWDEKIDGHLLPGTEIMTIGYPGYYYLELTFEVGHVRNERFQFGGRDYVSSRDSVFRGQSGGPTIAVSNGKVIGMNDALIERTDELSPWAHQHGSISLYVPYYQLNAVMRAVH